MNYSWKNRYDKLNVLVEIKLKKLNRNFLIFKKPILANIFEGSHWPTFDLMGCILFEDSLRLKVKYIFEWVNLLVYPIWYLFCGTPGSKGQKCPCGAVTFEFSDNYLHVKSIILSGQLTVQRTTQERLCWLKYYIAIWSFDVLLVFILFLTNIAMEANIFRVFTDLYLWYLEGKPFQCTKQDVSTAP